MLFMAVTIALVSLSWCLTLVLDMTLPPVGVGIVTRWLSILALSVDQTQWQNQYARDREYLQFHSEAPNKPEPVINSTRHSPCQTDIEDPPHWLALCKKHRHWVSIQAFLQPFRAWRMSFYHVSLTL